MRLYNTRSSLIVFFCKSNVIARQLYSEGPGHYKLYVYRKVSLPFKELLYATKEISFESYSQTKQSELKILPKVSNG